MNVFRKISSFRGSCRFKRAKRNRNKSMWGIEKATVFLIMARGYKDEVLGLSYDRAPAESCYIRDGRIYFVGRKRNLSWGDWVKWYGYIEVTVKKQ